jgi:hypothetical protein
MTQSHAPTAYPTPGQARAPGALPTVVPTPTLPPTPYPTVAPSQTPRPTLTLSVTVAGSGTVTRIPHKAIYTYRMGVILNPVANHGWSFAGWSGPNASDPVRIQDDTWSLTMDSNKELIAVFAEERFYVVTTIEGEGTVTNSPGNPYVYGQTATLTPLAQPGWSLDSWAGPDGLFVLENLDGTWSLTVDGSKKVTAIFRQDR